MNTNYDTYNALDFAQDDQFIKWVKSDDAAIHRFWKIWLEDHPDKAAILAEAKSIVKSIQVTEPEPKATKVQALWDKIETEIATETKLVPINKKRRIAAWLPYAAAAAIAGLLFFVFYDPGLDIETNYAEVKKHTLPDGSIVALNAASKIKYDPDTWETNRKVKLEGEAFFEVEKGARFVVETPTGQVEVLGTSFNVYARETDLEVECFTGKVAVQTNTANKRTLTPGYATRSQSSTVLSDTFSIDTQEKAGWRNGKIDLDDVTLRRALEEIERQFDCTIETLVKESTLEELHDFYFETNNLDSALLRVTFVGHVDYKKDGQKIVVSEN